MFSRQYYKPPTISPNIKRQLQENWENKELKNDIMKCNTVKKIAERLHNEVIRYQASLYGKQDIALQLVSFNATTIILVDSIGYIDYSLVVFRGKDNNGNALELIQHISQLSFLIYPVSNSVEQEPTDETPHRPIGFQAY